MTLDPETAMIDIKPQLQAVTRATATCAERATTISRKFQDWLDYACEMHAACVDQERTEQDAVISNEIRMAAESHKLESQRDAVGSARGAADLLAKQVSMTSDAFKIAAAKCPSE